MKRLVFAFLLLFAAPATAATFVTAAFTGSINPGSANVKAPFNTPGSGFEQSLPFSGTFIYDADSIPVGPGVINDFFDPAAGPETETFTLSFGPLSFTLADHIDALVAPAVQYNNGQFNGFVFVADVLYGASYYQFRANGPTITVRLLDNTIPNPLDPNGFPTGTSLINARFNIGNASLNPVDPNAAIPEPSTWAMLIVGFGLVGAAMRRWPRLAAA